MRRAASEDNDVAEIIINSPNEWVVVNESHSPVRLRKKKREVIASISIRVLEG